MRRLMLMVFGVIVLFCAALGAGPGKRAGSEPKQPLLGHRSAPLLTVDGLTFKDLNRNGRLDPYEDWRLSADARTLDLVLRMNLEELAGVMVHGTLPSSGAMASLGGGKEYDLAKVHQMIEERPRQQLYHAA